MGGGGGDFEARRDAMAELWDARMLWMRLAARAVFDRDEVALTWGASGKVPVGLAPAAPISAAVPTALRLVVPSAEGDGLKDGGTL